MNNPLVADIEDSGNWATGSQTLDYAVSTFNELKQGHWLGGGLNLVATGLGALGSITDPLGALAVAGVGWVLEHVSFLREFLDWLGGKPDTITSYATTWDNIRQRLEDTAENMLAAVRTDTADWIGDWVEEYRTTLDDHTKQIKAAASTAGGLSVAVGTAGLLVATVRTTVRDTIADVVGKRISKALQAVTVVLIPKVAIEIGLMAAKVSTQIMKVINKMLAALQRLGSRIERLTEILKTIKKSSDRWSGSMELSITKMRTGYYTASNDAHILNGDSGRLRQFQAAYQALFRAGAGGDFSTSLADATETALRGAASTAAENAILNLLTQTEARTHDGTINGYPV